MIPHGEQSNSIRVAARRVAAVASLCAPYDGDEDDYCGDEATLHGPDGDPTEGAGYRPIPAAPGDRLALLGGLPRRKIPGIRIEHGDGKQVRAASATQIRKLARRTKRLLTAFCNESVRRDEAKARGEKVGKPVMLVLRLPTGAGKTQKMVETVSEFLSRHPYTWIETPTGDGHKCGWGRAPVAVVGPSYRLLEEIIGKFEGGVDCEGNPMPAVETGWYRGAIEGGCLRSEERRLLEEAGMSAARLCQQQDADGEVVRCPHYDTCPVIALRRLYSQDPWGRGHWSGGKLTVGDCGPVPGRNQVPAVVGLPRAYGVIGGKPLNVARPRIAVIDESVLDTVFRETSLPLSILGNTTRKEPVLGKTEIEQGISKADLMAEYDGLVRALAAGLGRREDAAEAVAIHVLGDTAPRVGDDLRLDWTALSDADFDKVEKAISVVKRVTSRSFDASAEIDATLTAAEDIDRIRAVSATPASEYAHPEWRAWTILGERVELMRKRADVQRKLDVMEGLGGAVRGADPRLADKLREELDGPLADPAGREIRVQLAPDGETVDIAWRAEWTWKDVPTVVLDASANEELYRAAFGRDFDVRFIDLGLEVRLRTILVLGQGNATSTLCPDPKDRGKKDKHGRDLFEEAAKRREKLKTATEAILWLHRGDSVLTASTKKVEDVIRGWAPGAELVGDGKDPYAKLDEALRTAHFGALRGLDYAKFFGAVVNFGKLELPEDVAWRLAVAASYDQPRQEDTVAPADDGEGSSRIRIMRRIRLRDGGTLVVPVSVYRDRWMRLIQQQAREEEIVQAVGRLRPVHKLDRGDDPSGWQVSWLLCDCVPEGTVIDDVIHLDDLVHLGKILRVSARNNGCLSAFAWAEAGMIRRQKRTLRAGRTDEAAEKALLKSARKALANLGFSEDVTPPAGWATVKVRRSGVGNPWIVVHVDLSATDDPVAAAMGHVRATGRDVIGGELAARTDAPAPTAVEAEREEDTRAPREERVAEAKEAMADTFAVFDGEGQDEFRVAVEALLYARQRVRLDAAAEAVAELARVVSEHRPSSEWTTADTPLSCRDWDHSLSAARFHTSAISAGGSGGRWREVSAPSPATGVVPGGRRPRQVRSGSRVAG